MKQEHDGDMVMRKYDLVGLSRVAKNATINAAVESALRETGKTDIRELNFAGYSGRNRREFIIADKDLVRTSEGD